jgi:hypothetical protein
MYNKIAIGKSKENEAQTNAPLDRCWLIKKRKEEPKQKVIIRKSW